MRRRSEWDFNNKLCLRFCRTFPSAQKDDLPAHGSSCRTLAFQDAGGKTVNAAACDRNRSLLSHPKHLMKRFGVLRQETEVG